MAPRIEGLALEALPGAVPAWRARVDAALWRRACESVARSGGRLGCLWASDERERPKDERERSGAFAVHVVLVVHEGLVCLDLPLQAESYPDVSDLFPAASRMQRAVRDLMGLHAGAD